MDKRALILLGAIVLVIGGIGFVVWAKVGKTTGENIEHTIQAPDIAREILSIPQVERKIQAHLAAHGSYPESLEVLGELPRLPDGKDYAYDPEDGSVWLVDVE